MVYTLGPNIHHATWITLFHSQSSPQRKCLRTCSQRHCTCFLVLCFGAFALCTDKIISTNMHAPYWTRQLACWPMCIRNSLTPNWRTKWLTVLDSVKRVHNTDKLHYSILGTKRNTVTVYTKNSFFAVSIWMVSGHHTPPPQAKAREQNETIQMRSRFGWNE